MPDYAVRLPDFEGPLDVLLRLIEKRELEISKVALAAVADQFLAYVHALAAPDPQLLAAFLSVAAKLLLIKSQALLPQPITTPPPGDDEEDMGAELVERLREYRAIQAAAAHLRAREQAGLRSYPHPAPLTRPVAAPTDPGSGLEGVTLAHLLRLVQRRMQLALPLAPQPALIPHEITLDEKVADLRARLAAAPARRLSVAALLAEAQTRAEIVITFMAVLELARRHAILAVQAAAFDDIVIAAADAER